MNKRILFLLITLVAVCTPLMADSKADIKPLGEPAPVAKSPASANETAIRAELEKEYRAEMEKRLAYEIERHEASLTNLWVSNAVIWSVLLIFVVMQALSAKKRATELARLRAMKDD
ncbi:hypothetical protein OAU50_01525 [Planctomycetota bacterium]|nr:hypothetical protein [Planctomycetota bacterium]